MYSIQKRIPRGRWRSRPLKSPAFDGQTVEHRTHEAEAVENRGLEGWAAENRGLEGWEVEEGAELSARRGGRRVGVRVYGPWGGLFARARRALIRGAESWSRSWTTATSGSSSVRTRRASPPSRSSIFSNPEASGCRRRPSANTFNWGSC